MLRRGLAALVVAMVAGGVVLAEETRGSITKIEDGKITIRSGGFGKQEAKEHTFKVSKDVKITKTAFGKDAKDKDPVKLTLDELKTAAKVTNVFVTVVHDDDTASEIKVGFGGGGFKDKGKDKGKDKKKGKDDQ
jgi:hypothetical protein